MPSVSIPAALAGIGTALAGAATGVGSAIGIGGAGLAGATAGAAGAAGAAAATVPGWLGLAGTAASVLGGVTGAVGAYETGQSQAAAANYNANLAKQNAAVERQNSAIAGQAGAEQQFQVGLHTRSEVGAIAANQAASGIDVNSGSASDTRLSAEELGQLDSLTVRSNATREAYGYNQRASSEDAQSTLDRFQADNSSTAGLVNAGSTLLGSLGSGASNYAKYQLSGGIGFGG